MVAVRFLAILFLTARHGITFCARAAGLCLRRRKCECGRVLGECVARLCEDLGPTFIKVGQILSSRPDLLPESMGPPLLRLQDQIAPFDSARIPGIIESALGRPLPELFASFEFAPVAAASIAQVHRARLKDGREVAVKIRRPGICRVVDNDLRILKAIAKALSLLPGMRAVPMLELVADVQLPIRQQLDFYLEAANNRRFRAAFAASEHIKIPELVENMCTEDVLTMEYLGRLRRTDAALTVDDRKTAALAGLRALYKMIFIDGFIHADMHSGNVFTREFGEFVILDTGLVASLDQSDRRDFVDFFFGLVNNDSRECVRIIYDRASYRPRNFNREAFAAAMSELIARHSALKSHEFEVALFVYQLIALQRRFKIRGSTKFMMTILSMVVFDGICKRLYPLCDFQKESRAFLITARYSGKPLRTNPQGRCDGSRKQNRADAVPEDLWLNPTGSDHELNMVNL